MMYTDTFESESEFMHSLLSSHNIKMEDGETAVVCTCPKCRKGNVLTRRTVEKVKGDMRTWRFDHYCDTCGERFPIGKIEADIFFHRPYELLDKLETPFGDVHVKVNGKNIPFRYRTDTFADDCHTHDKPVLIHLIDIDMSGLRLDDTVFCGFENNILEYNDSDERVVLHSCESDTQILGFSAFEPDDEESYCYQLETYDGDGFGYRVTTDPGSFDSEHFYQSKFATLAIAVLNKTDYEDADSVLFLALC